MSISFPLPTPDHSGPVHSNRPGESAGNFAMRLRRARLGRTDRANIDATYARLDAEWLAEGWTSRPERAPWFPLDILEWKDLTEHQQYLDLKTYALAADRAAKAACRGGTKAVAG